MENIKIYSITLYVIVEEIIRRYYILILTYTLQRDEIKIHKYFFFREKHDI